MDSCMAHLKNHSVQQKIKKNDTHLNADCGDRRPISTSPRPISNFKINRKTLLYINISFIFLVMFSSYVKIVYMERLKGWLSRV
jgi:hypothetical protein